MKIIIVGCGKVGATLAEQLSDEDNDIVIIDQKYDRIQEVSTELDIMGYVGNGCSPAILKEAGLEEADLLIAVTESDELNLLCCLIAQKTGGCQTIARIRNPEYHKDALFFQEEFGIAMILNPEFVAAQEIARLLRFPSAIKIETFSKGRIELLQFRVPANSTLHNKRVHEIASTFFKYEILICAVTRGKEVIIPDGNFLIQAQDVISIVSSPAHTSQFFKKINIQTNQAKNAMIVGGGKVAFYLSRLLLTMGIDVTIIEKNPERCDMLSDSLPKATIICGDATDTALLEEEDVESRDAFVALTDSDEENILLSLIVNDRCPKTKVIAKIDNSVFSGIIDKLSLDTVIDPKYITAANIVRYVRAMKNSIGSNVETLYRLVNNQVEALEFNVRENSRVLNTPLEDLKLKSSLLIACIIRDRKLIMPRGRDCIKQGDKVIVVTTNKGLNDIADILAER